MTDMIQAAMSHLSTVRWRATPWRIVFLASYVGVNAVLIPTKIVLDPTVAVDWQTITALPAAIERGAIYDLVTPVPFVWSPVAAWMMAGAVLFGYWPWILVHVASVFLLRSPLLIGLVLVSYGFWFDAAQGNTVTFVLVAGMLALAGSRWAAITYFALLILMPRPLMAPLAVWLVWHDRSLLRPFAVMFAIHAVVVVASGYALSWPAALMAYEISPGITIGPTAILGKWWLLFGIPLGAWLTWRGHLGWAGLAVSPYITPQYVIWPLLELVRRQPSEPQPSSERTSDPRP